MLFTCQVRLFYRFFYRYTNYEGKVLRKSLKNYFIKTALFINTVLFKLCVACSTMVYRQLNLKQCLIIAIYSLINYIKEFFIQQYNFCKQQYNKKFCSCYFKGFFSSIFASRSYTSLKLYVDILLLKTFD